MKTIIKAIDTACLYLTGRDANILQESKREKKMQKKMQSHTQKNNVFGTHLSRD